MNKLQKALVGVISLAVGGLTLRKLRGRRSEGTDGAEPDVETESEGGESDPGETALEEARAAAEHTTAAIQHARTAGENAVQYVRQEKEGDRTDTTAIEA